jgi:LPXTG-site transpeptidase (sortase) family protein
MTGKRSYIWGGIQIGFILCTIGSLVVCAAGTGLWQAGEDLFEIFGRSGQSAELKPLDVTPVTFQVVVPTGQAGLSSLPGGPIDPNALPTPIPRQGMGVASPLTMTPTATVAAPPSLQSQPGTSVVGNSNQAVLAPPDLSDWLATRLVIPSMALDAPVIISPIVGDTWDVDHLNQEVGHLERTASPGSASNVVLAGHVTLAPDGRAGPFKRLRELVPGDLVTIYKGEQPFTYRVDHTRTVKPTDIEVTYPTNEPTLTLITCLNFNSAEGRYEDRLVVIGYLEP